MKLVERMNVCLISKDSIALLEKNGSWFKELFIPMIKSGSNKIKDLDYYWNEIRNVLLGKKKNNTFKVIKHKDIKFISFKVSDDQTLVFAIGSEKIDSLKDLYNLITTVKEINTAKETNNIEPKLIEIIKKSLKPFGNVKQIDEVKINDSSRRVNIQIVTDKSDEQMWDIIDEKIKPIFADKFNVEAEETSYIGQKTILCPVILSVKSNESKKVNESKYLIKFCEPMMKPITLKLDDGEFKRLKSSNHYQGEQVDSITPINESVKVYSSDEHKFGDFKRGINGHTYGYITIDHPTLGTFYVGVDIIAHKLDLNKGNEVWDFMNKEPKTDDQWNYIINHQEEIIKATKGQRNGEIIESYSDYDTKAATDNNNSIDKHIKQLNKEDLDEIQRLKDEICDLSDGSGDYGDTGWVADFDGKSDFWAAYETLEELQRKYPDEKIIQDIDYEYEEEDSPYYGSIWCNYWYEDNITESTYEKKNKVISEEDIYDQTDEYYLLKSDTMIIEGVKGYLEDTILYRIYYKDGTKGGWIESTNNLDASNGARVLDEAIVDYNARVAKCAKVYGNAKVSVNARIYGSAQVGGNAILYDCYVGGDTKIDKGKYEYGHYNSGVNPKPIKKPEKWRMS